MFWEQPIQYASLSDVGFRRQTNQDSHSVLLSQNPADWERRGHLFLVADGMGGHAVGELASKMAADIIPHMYHKLPDDDCGQALKGAIEQANAAIYQRGSQVSDFERMGTTCSTLVLGPQGAYVGHIGDSRVYRVRHNRIDQLSRDHSLVWEMIEQRKIKPHQAEQLVPRNVITRCLGPEELALVDLEGPFPVEPGDIFLLCSDGLTGLLNDSEIGTICSELPPLEAARLLVNLTNLRGGFDNTTVIIVRVGDAPPDVKRARSPGPSTTQTDLPAAIFLGICGIVVLGLASVIFFLKPGLEWMGWILSGVTFAIILLWLFLLRRSRKLRAMQIPIGDSHSTILWRPYRTAEAKMSRELLHRLAQMESELQRAAHEEHWEIDWVGHRDCLLRMQDAAREKKYGKAMRELGKAYEILMVGVHQQRKQIHRDSRWGKQASPEPASAEMINDAPPEGASPIAQALPENANSAPPNSANPSA